MNSNAIRDFLILHYIAVERDDAPFWRDCRSIEPPGELARKLALFRANGRIHREADELFAELELAASDARPGRSPEAHHAMADGLTPAELEEFLANLRRIIAGAVERMPHHADFIAGVARSTS